LFEKFSTFIEWAVKIEAGTDRVTHYMDDFYFTGVSDEKNFKSCSHIVRCFENVCKKLGVPLAAEKSVGPVTKITYLGLEIDSVTQLISIPQEKLASIL
jgi:hypothetical protein